MDIRITAAGTQEIPIVHKIMRMAFEDYRNVLTPPSGALTEEVEQIEKKIAGNGGAILVWINREPVGSAQYYFEADYMYIGRVSVVKEARGLGIASSMMKHLEQIAKDRSTFETRIEVRLSIPQNLEFYAKLGYETIEQWEYPNGEDKWNVMRKRL